MEEKIIQILIQGGLASVALVSLYFNYKSNQEFTQVISNHIQHSTDAMIELTKVIESLKEAIKNHFNK